MVSRGVKAGQRTQFQFKIKKRPVDGFGGGQLLNSTYTIIGVRAKLY